MVDPLDQAALAAVNNTRNWFVAHKWPLFVVLAFVLGIIAAKIA
jgi:hypothetical protein